MNPTHPAVRLGHVLFWIAASAAGMSLVVPERPGTLLAGLAGAGAVMAWFFWRFGVSAQRRERLAQPADPVAALGEAALLDVAQALARSVDQATSLDAALRGVGRVLHSELGVGEVKALRVDSYDAVHALVAEIVDSQPGFRAAARALRLDCGQPLAIALRQRKAVVGTDGSAVVPVVRGAAVAALLLLGAPAMALPAGAYEALLDLAAHHLARWSPPDSSRRADPYRA